MGLHHILARHVINRSDGVKILTIVMGEKKKGGSVNEKKEERKRVPPTHTT